MKTFPFVLAALATTASALEMCSERAFQTAIENAPKTAASVGCQRAVFFSLCEECGRDLGCYMSNAPKIAPTLPACQFPARRQLRSSSRCSEATFQKAVAAAPNTGAALGCQRAVYNELCDKCGEDQECFWEHGRKIAPTLQQCRPRRLTSYEMDVEEDVGGVGRWCATAACLFIDGLNPPPARYRPGSPGPAPIGRLYDEDEMDDEMDDEFTGHYKLPHDNHNPQGWPGHDEMEDEIIGHENRHFPHHDNMDDVYDEEAGRRWPGGPGPMPGQGPSWPGQGPNPPPGQFRL